MTSKVDVPRARAMREAGMTLQVVGDEFGVSRERVRQLVGSIARALNCEHCGEPFETARADQRFCSKGCAVVANRHHVLCECGESMSPTASLCWDCTMTTHDEKRGARWTEIARLWAEGVSMKEIAHAFDTTTNALGVEMARMRNAGQELPFRRRGWKGHSRATAPAPRPPETPQHARLQFAQAIRSGQIRRPSRCERCGAEGYVDGHHHDYSKPLFVEWLCHSCHLSHHAAERAALKAAA